METSCTTLNSPAWSVVVVSLCVLMVHEQVAEAVLVDSFHSDQNSWNHSQLSVHEYLDCWFDAGESSVVGTAFVAAGNAVQQE